MTVAPTTLLSMTDRWSVITIDYDGTSSTTHKYHQPFRDKRATFRYEWFTATAPTTFKTVVRDDDILEWNVKMVLYYRKNSVKERVAIVLELGPITALKILEPWSALAMLYEKTSEENVKVIGWLVLRIQRHHGALELEECSRRR